MDGGAGLLVEHLEPGRLAAGLGDSAALRAAAGADGPHAGRADRGGCQGGIPPRGDGQLRAGGGLCADGTCDPLRRIAPDDLVSFTAEQTGKHAQTVLVAFIALAVAAWQHLAGVRRVAAVLMAAAGLMLVFNALSIHNLQTDLIPRFAPTPPEMATWKVKDLPTSGIPWVKERSATPNRYLLNGPQSRHLPAEEDGGDVGSGVWDGGTADGSGWSRVVKGSRALIV